MIKEYRDLYSKYDVLMLADVFEKFRNRCLKNYGFCLFVHYLSTPALHQPRYYFRHWRVLVS